MRRTSRLLALAGALSLAAAFAWAGADRSRPPSPEPPRPLQPPAVSSHTLQNGLPVRIAPMREVPVVEVVLVIRAGAGADPLERPGLASLTADMLDEGAGGRDTLQLADAVDFLGAELSTGASWDASVIRLHVPVSRMGEALSLMSDVALRPAFGPAELERLRREALTGILQARDQPRRIAALALARAVFGEGHRYGLPLDGDARSVAAFQAPDLRRFHAQHYHPESAALMVAGDVDAVTVLPLLERSFGAWPRGRSAPVTLPAPRQLRERRVVLVDRPGAAQSVLRLGRVGPPRDTPNHVEIEVMNTLLGGSFTSRLNDNLREQHGYSYGAFSGFDYRRVGGVFQAASDVQTSVTAEALGEVVKELTRIRTRAGDEEVERARNYLAYGYAQDFETTRQMAARLAEQWLYGLPEDTFSRFVPRALALGGAQVQATARGLIDPGKLAIVVVGDRAGVEAKIAALRLGPIDVLTVDELLGPAPKLDEAAGR
jgi:predicted Zn-dependent peptidase